MDAIVVFVFYGCVVVPRTLALLDPFSCSRKTKNKGTLILSIDRFSCRTIGWFCTSIQDRHLGVEPSMKYCPNRHCLEIGAKSSLGARNVIATL